MKRIIMITICIMLLFSCSSTSPIHPVSRMAFPVDEYSILSKEGNAVIRGQAFLKTRGGDVKTAAGNQVILNPVTSYSIEWYEKSYLTGKPIDAPDPRLLTYIKKQTADADGRFKFKGVPPGEYFVTTVVFWEAPTGYKGSLRRQGGSVTKRVIIKNNQELDVILTR